MLIKIHVDFGWRGCESVCEIEVDDNATDEEIEELAVEAGEQHALERIYIEWEKIEDDEEPLTDENRPELTIKERNK